MARLPRLTRTLAVTAAVTLSCFPLAASGGTARAATALTGPDVASYQHPNGKSIDWSEVRSAGQSFAIVKATEGTTYVNPYFAGDYAGSLAAGLVHGAYHFARPATPVASTAIAQADFFAGQLGPMTTPSTLPPILDLEVTGGLSSTQLTAWAQSFLQELTTRTGRTPMLYTYPAFWTNDIADHAALASYPLWMASYGTSTAPQADLWQYTDDATISGISGTVDVSRYVGAGGTPWSTLSDGTSATPAPPVVAAAPTSMSVQAASSVVQGSAVTVAGTLTSADTKAAQPDETVELYHRHQGKTQWTHLQTLTTDSEGDVSTTLRPDVSADLKLTFAGSPQRTASSVTASVLVRPKVDATMSATTVAAGTRVTIHGTSSSSHAGQKVWRQAHSAQGWTSHAVGRIGSSGTFSLSFHANSSGTKQERIATAAANNQGRGYSAAMSLTVR